MALSAQAKSLMRTVITNPAVATEITTAIDAALTKSGDQTLGDGKDIALGTSTGTKLGTSATQKLGFWGATPVVRQNHIADPNSTTMLATVKTLLARLETVGILKTS